MHESEKKCQESSRKQVRDNQRARATISDCQCAQAIKCIKTAELLKGKPTHEITPVLACNFSGYNFVILPKCRFRIVVKLMLY